MASKRRDTTWRVFDGADQPRAATYEDGQEIAEGCVPGVLRSCASGSRTALGIAFCSRGWLEKRE